MKKIAIIGASYLQLPLVKKAKEMGLETHVFAWSEGNLVEGVADFFYPISILEKQKILDVCQEIKIDGITSIASDIAMPTVNFVACKLGLIGNSIETAIISTDKFEMRKALESGGVPCPKFEFFSKPNFINKKQFRFPVIVKPTDRSGSRGVTKIDSINHVNEALKKVLDISLSNRAIIEEFITGREFSVEMISYEGNHYPITITDKVTTGSPYFVEIEHHEPTSITNEEKSNINKSVVEALNILNIKNGASHSEVFLLNDGNIRIVEIAGRMGGDFIGSHMVELSTGYDFVKGVIEVALGNFTIPKITKNSNSGVYYVLLPEGKIKTINTKINNKHVMEAIPILKEGDYIHKIVDGADKRAGIIVYSHPSEKVELIANDILKFEIE